MKKEELRIVKNNKTKNQQNSGEGIIRMSYPAMGNHFENDEPKQNSEDEKRELLKYHIGEIMRHTGCFSSEKGLIERLILPVTMLLRESISDQQGTEKPQVLLYESDAGYRQMTVISNISFRLLSVSDPIYKGVVHVGYYASGLKIRPSDLRSLILYFAFISENEEKLLHFIVSELKSLLKTESLAIVLKLQERGHIEKGSIGPFNTMSVHFEGNFLREEIKVEFFSLLQ